MSFVKCPNCGSKELTVEISFAGQVACKFMEGDNFELIENVALESNWDDHSSCECMNCLWVGTVEIARDGQTEKLEEIPSLEKKPAFLNPISKEEIQELKRLLNSQRCPSLWCEYIDRLISEVERLNKFIEMISHLTHTNPEVGMASSEDTVVG